MQQRDARSARQKGTFFRSRDNSPSSGHLTRRSLLCQNIIFIITPYIENASISVKKEKRLAQKAQSPPSLISKPPGGVEIRISLPVREYSL